MSATPKLLLETRPDLTIGRMISDRLDYSERQSIGRVVLVVGLILLSPALVYFFLMLLLPIALVQLTREMLKARRSPEPLHRLPLVERGPAPATPHSAPSKAA